VLHDVIEDAPEFTQAIHTGFSSLIFDALLSVTHSPGEDYQAFIDRAGANPIGRTVKLADVRDNLAPDRRASLSTGLQIKYLQALAVLEAPF
jgi:guanosine-3',5'-bis(diphosphate) 3'-pyrophosphohydrolase